MLIVYVRDRIVDIAQTCQETFPFAMVAARHGRSVDEVIEAFSAVVQLPLLRQVVDGERYAPLAAERLRLYREARVAMMRSKEVPFK